MIQWRREDVGYEFTKLYQGSYQMSGIGVDKVRTEVTRKACYPNGYRISTRVGYNALT